MWALRSSCRREPPPRAKLGRPAQVVVPGGGLFALANTLVRGIISRCIMHARTPDAVLGGRTGTVCSYLYLYLTASGPEPEWLSKSSHRVSPPRVARSRVARLRARSARGKIGFGAVQESFS